MSGSDESSASARSAREIPARALPTPKTVSPEMQKLVGAPPGPFWSKRPGTFEEWKEIVEAAAQPTLRALPALCERLRVTYERTILGGVRACSVVPRAVTPENRNRLLLHIHGGCYVWNPAKTGLPEAVLMAGFGGFKVLSVDYRMPPEAFFPAALDDVVAAWKAARKLKDPRRMAVFGTSAGEALTLALILRAKSEGLPLPAAIASGTPMSDVTKTGDTFYTNELVDNVLVSRDGLCQRAVEFYANGRDLADPLLSPVYGGYSGFPPSIFTSGTRDLLLSNTARAHRKLRQAGVEAQLHVYEGQSHAQYLSNVEAPETAEAFEEIAGFFNRRLGR